jgi:hypothetical protein
LIKYHEIISPLQGFVRDKFRAGGCASLHRRLCTSRPMRGYGKYFLTFFDQSFMSFLSIMRNISDYFAWSPFLRAILPTKRFGFVAS